MITIGRTLFWLGALLMLLGGVIWLAGRLGLPLGRLPGDLRFERDGVTVYAPLATSLLLSFLLTVLLNLLAAFKK